MNNKYFYEGQYGPDYEGQNGPIETVYGDGQFDGQLIENPDEMQMGFDQYRISPDAEQMLLGNDQYGDFNNYVQLGADDQGFSGDLYGNENGLIIPSEANFAPMSNLRAPNIRVPAANAVVNRANFSASWDPVVGATSYIVSFFRIEHGRLRDVFTGRQITTTFTTITASQLTYGELHRIEVVARSGNQSSPVAVRQFRVRENNRIAALQNAINAGGIHRPCNQYVNRVLNSLGIRIAGGDGDATPLVYGMLNWLNSNSNHTWARLGANFSEAWRRAQLGIPTIAIAPRVNNVFRLNGGIWGDSIQHVAMVIPNQQNAPNRLQDLRLASGGATPGLNLTLNWVWAAGSTGWHHHPGQNRLVQSNNPQAHVRFFSHNS